MGARVPAPPSLSTARGGADPSPARLSGGGGVHTQLSPGASSSAAPVLSAEAMANEATGSSMTCPSPASLFSRARVVSTRAGVETSSPIAAAISLAFMGFPAVASRQRIRRRPSSQSVGPGEPKRASGSSPGPGSFAPAPESSLTCSCVAEALGAGGCSVSSSGSDSSVSRVMASRRRRSSATSSRLRTASSSSCSAATSASAAASARSKRSNSDVITRPALMPTPHEPDARPGTPRHGISHQSKIAGADRKRLQRINPVQIQPLEACGKTVVDTCKRLTDSSWLGWQSTPASSGPRIEGSSRAWRAERETENGSKTAHAN